MASRKPHPDVGRFIARHEHGETESLDTSCHHSDPHTALAAEAEDLDDGDIVYVYEIVGVYVVRQPTLTEEVRG